MTTTDPIAAPACRMTEEDHAALETRWAWLGESEAMTVHCAGASLGSAREAAISAFTRGFDTQAAALLGGGA